MDRAYYGPCLGYIILILPFLCLLLSNRFLHRFAGFCSECYLKRQDDSMLIRSRIHYVCQSLKRFNSIAACHARSYSNFQHLPNLRAIRSQTRDENHSSLRRLIFKSRTTDPFINLAIEDHLLRNSAPDSHILFTYVNRPCIVIGRNQNPWLEVNLEALRSRRNVCQPPATEHWATDSGTQSDENYAIDLVRRRSGGGSVFHDEGNLNYSFIVPNDQSFSRNKHAEMVVRAIKHKLPVDMACSDGQDLLAPELRTGVRVNERHDIVMPQRTLLNRGPHQRLLPEHSSEVKVSGSAYKITRGRALHHGTLLFSCPNLSHIGHFLHSPAKPFLNAKGVESVRSPIGNLRFSPEPAVRERLRTHLEDAIGHVFQEVYGRALSTTTAIAATAAKDAALGHGGSGLSPEITLRNDDIGAREAILAGADELRSLDWKYLQTPSFSLKWPPVSWSSLVNVRPASASEHTGLQEGRSSENGSPAPPLDTRIFLKVQHGILAESRISTSADEVVAEAQAQQSQNQLAGKKLHEIAKNWRAVFADWHHGGPDNAVAVSSLTGWLEKMFPPVS